MSESINSNNKENYGKFVVGNSSDTGEGRIESVGSEFGQVKYAKRGAGKSIYDDPTRDTDNDKAAAARMNECPTGDDDESQDGMY